MITEEQLNALKPEGFDDAQWKDLGSKFMTLHDNDISGLKNNELKIKQEKVDLMEKFNAAKSANEAEVKKYTDEIASLNGQIRELKKNSPESIKAAFEQKQTELSNLLESTKSDFAAQIAAKDQQIASLTEGVFQRDCVEAFEKAIQGKNIDSSTIQDIRTFCMGDNYSKFKRVNVGDGKSIITRDDGKDIASAVDEFFSTPTGKRFLFNGNSGGGADGGKGTPAPAATTMSRADFDAITDPAKKLEAAQKYKII